ncbi:hypothetical protein CHRY9390_00917 [Chryseobacterium aquaeductus]|uniref:Uncharacterized protein n=1 Tax=Chryseobacterium aquaeductus TaxID=2675056 RepID=A0A9N8MEC8_9FLAO|nr:hypothetical protein [Chryseobacterium aquaeductus]CAA7330256.1 hypothetical protein CHRY9390_00917 [Chryseobacterium potabilaquae]CAD7802362.1 hypothetical protein CHRY9390_00917 [Chryseobacterium aquaeductus]
MNPDKLQAVKKLLESRTSPKEVAKTLEISVAILYRWIPISGKLIILVIANIVSLLWFEVKKKNSF